MLLLDTDILIDIQRGYAPALTWFSSLSESPFIPGFVVMELIQDAQNAQQVQKVIKLIAPLSVVWPTDKDCSRALSDFTSYHLTHGLGLIDSLIAACSNSLSATLCTFNVKHYKMIPGLILKQPYPR
jgi:predicted nucleic acid-binding protein